MAFRTGHSYTVPGRGTVVTGRKGAKTFTGKGPAPAGTKKVAAPKLSEVPTVTTSPTGQVTTSGFSSPPAATRAVRRSQAAHARVRRITKALALTAQNPPQERSAPQWTTKPGTIATTTRATRALPAPTAKPKTFQGQKTAGAPTFAALRRASKTGTLKTNKAGFAVTPEVAKATRKLKVARKTVRRTTGVTGPLTASQNQIAKQVAKETGLKPRTIATQELQEESGSAAAQRDAERNFDVLNIGYSDSGPLGLTAGSEWKSPKTAARATSEFFKGRKYSPSAAIASILPAAKGKSAAKQLQVIGNSGWATSAYAKDLAATSQLVGEKHNPKAVRALQAAKQEAQRLGLKTTSSVGPAPKQLVTRFKAAKRAMQEVEGLPYVWGGGHGSPTSSPTGGGLDCSGAVGYVLNKIGALKGSLTSGEIGSVLKPGPGALTVFYNAGHTFLRRGNEYWGTSVGDSGAGGLGPHPAPSASYLAQYNVGHVPGMGLKQALQLGFKNLGTGGAQAFPGMTLSSSGTTATIDQGAGATVGKPGFSKRPIQLTHTQKVERTFKQLEALGVVKGKGQEAKASTPPGGVSVKELERKYGKAAA